MQTLNYWKQFENTGKIEDYLTYIANDSQRSEGAFQTAGCKSDYRDSFKNVTDREGADENPCRNSYR